MSTAPSEPQRPRWWRRRWLWRAATPVVVLALLYGADRALHRLWYLPTFQEGGAAARLRDLPHHKNFIRFAPDPWLRWRYHPNMTLKLMEQNRVTGVPAPYLLQTNSLGFRGPQLEREKPAGVLRVVALGGSSTMGHGVSYAQTFTARLARALGRRLPGRTVEVINAGVQGYTSVHGFLQYYRDLRPLSPDLLIVAFDLNDGYHPQSVQQVARWREPRGAREEALRHALRNGPATQLSQLSGRWSAADAALAVLYESGSYMLYQYLRSWLGWRGGKAATRRGMPPPGPDPAPGGAALRCPAVQRLGAVSRPWDAHVAVYRAYLKALDLLALRDGVPVIYLSIPVEGFADLRAAYPYSAIMAKLARAPRRRYVDPADRFCQHPIGEVMLDYCHPTAAGHDIIARALEPAALELLRWRVSR